MKINAIEIRGGNVLDHEGKLWQVLKSQIYQPGKGASVVQVEMRDVRTGTKTNVRFRTQETVERARLDEVEYQYLYDEGDGNFAFMNNDNYEQMSVSGDIIGEQNIYLQEGMKVILQMFESEALSVQLPTTVVLEITEADPVVKGQTASSSYKPAMLENGAKIMVPPHIEAGTKVVVKPEDGSYVERAK
ncbi:MAG: elongation factor P [Alphaproteobacteria bacterium]|nr:elongation factor P [Alphaproteobacteria bacterium SS10]